MNNIYDWNVVFRKCIEIKEEYLTANGYTPDFYNYDGYDNIFDRWIAELGAADYKDIFSRLEVRQDGNKVLLRYANYGDLYSEEEMTDEKLWTMYDGFYRECRSLVIDIKKETIVLCPFKKFVNINELPETSIENIQKAINNASIVEITNKLDGSMYSVRYYDNQFVSSTSQALTEESWRLADANSMLIEKYKEVIKRFPDYTFIFEYISMKDAHVVCYNKEQEGLYLIGMRNCKTGVEMTYQSIVEMAHAYGLKTTEIFNVSFDDILKSVDKYSSNEKEGWVIYIIDKDSLKGTRVKLKVDDYVKVSKILGGLSSINLVIENIASGTYDDLKSKVPAPYQSRIEDTAQIVFEYLRMMQEKVNYFYKKLPSTEDRKTCMIWIDKNVPTIIKGYVRNKYLGISSNFLRIGSSNNMGHKKINQIEKEIDILKGVGNENFSQIS